MMANKGPKQPFNPAAERDAFSISGPGVFPTLTPEEQSEALLLASQLDMDHETILRFGEDVQTSLKDFTHQLLVQVQRNDTSPIREILSQLIEQLDSIHPDELSQRNEGFFKKLFKRNPPIQQIISQYHRLSVQIDRLTVHLSRAQQNLLADNGRLDELYRKNEEFYQRISVYIAALEMKKIDVLKQLQAAEKNGEPLDNPMMQQKLLDMKHALEWLDRRMYDLQISREIAIQTAPQIRMIQSVNELLIEKIQSSILSTIPLWQSQISMLVHLNRQHRADETGKILMDATEKMSKKMDMPHGGNSFSPQDLQQLITTQSQLIESIEETLRIQADRNEKQQIVEKTIQEMDAK